MYVFECVVGGCGLWVYVCVCVCVCVYVFECVGVCGVWVYMCSVWVYVMCGRGSCGQLALFCVFLLSG